MIRDRLSSHQMGLFNGRMCLSLMLAAQLFGVSIAQASNWEFNWRRQDNSTVELRNGLTDAFNVIAHDAVMDNPELQQKLTQTLNAKLGDDSFGDFERYMETLLLNAEDVQIVGDQGEMRVNMTFASDRLRFPFGERNARSVGDIYAVDLERSVSFRVYYRQGSLYAADLRGMLVQVKLVAVPDTLVLKQFEFNIDNQLAALYASAVYDLIQLVARASVRLRRFEGVDWILPVLDAIPGFLSRARFSID